MKRLYALFLIVFLAMPACSQTPFGTFYNQRQDSIRDDSTRRLADTVGRGNSDKIKIVKKRVDYGKFVALGIATMAFVALIITTAQAWNPTGRNP